MKSLFILKVIGSFNRFLERSQVVTCVFLINHVLRSRPKRKPYLRSGDRGPRKRLLQELSLAMGRGPELPSYRHAEVPWESATASIRRTSKAI